MNRIISIAAFVFFGVSAHAIDYTQFSAAKRLRADKRYDEAIQKLEGMAAKTEDAGENFTYLDLAIDMAVESLKNAEKALALVGEVKDPAHRDFARLRVLADFERYDEALASVKGKDVDAWPVRCRSQAHGILAGIHHAKKDVAAELQEWKKTAESPGAEPGVRGRALRELGVLYLKEGKSKEAEEQFRQAIQVTPANYAWRVESLVALSRLLIEEQRGKEAVKVFEGTDFTKVSSMTSKGNLLEAYARALLAAGRRIKAIETFDELLKLDISAEWKGRINRELDEMAESF
ncbi:tetratricopeptide repeat protein [Prosthecobacter sp.]|uniref:tetratricopeptide repeat protein n=1 Tax=Prosthecobacter sp. TaxID=1965333 RepID=UPI003783383B